MKTMRHASRGTMWVAGFAFVLLGLPSARGQLLQETSRHIDLPPPSAPQSDAQRDWWPLDLHRLDLIVEDEDLDDSARFFYTTQGRFETGGPGPDVLFPGLLRYVDLKLPIGDLNDFGNDGDPYDISLYTGAMAVDHWNGILGGDTNPPEGKRFSNQGIISANGTLFVTGVEECACRPFQEVLERTVHGRWHGAQLLASLW